MFSDWLQIVGLLLTGIVIPILLTLRKESREQTEILHGKIASLVVELHQVKIDVAVLRERDRIGVLIDETLRKALESALPSRRDGST